jgi:hypothetical protein
VAHATVLEAVKGRAPRDPRRERFHPLTAPALRGRWSLSGRKASRSFDRLWRAEQKAAAQEEGRFFGGRPRRRGVSVIALRCWGGRRLCGTRSAFQLALLGRFQPALHVASVNVSAADTLVAKSGIWVDRPRAPTLSTVEWLGVKINPLTATAGSSRGWVAECWVWRSNSST